MHHQNHHRRLAWRRIINCGYAFLAASFVCLRGVNGGPDVMMYLQHLSRTLTCVRARILRCVSARSSLALSFLLLSLSLSHSLTLSHSLSLTLSLSLYLSRSLSLSCSLSLALSLSLFTLSLSHTHTLSLFIYLSLFLSRPLARSLSLPLSPQGDVGVLRLSGG